MSKTKGVIDPAATDKKEMFVGWSKAPAVDRRFLLGALPLGLAAGGGASWLMAKKQGDPGAGAWLTGETHRITGVLSNAPYPMIRLPDDNAPFGMRTVLVVAEGKCTSSLKLDEARGRSVMASGVLIERKDRQMLEVPPFLDKWIEYVDAGVADVEALASPPEERLGTARLSGVIMDSKCFFGVMRPSYGKTHKACAALCIRGGIPPSFWARSKDGKESVMLMTDANGGPMPMDILPLVADPVDVEGEIWRVGDLLQLRAGPLAFKRI
ncbi:MAG: hypothetical protein AAGD92_15435 [Pseudomonadota bacterium]